MTTTIAGATGSFTDDPWTINSNVYSIAGLQYGVNYTQSITYDPIHPNIGANINWYFPAEPANAIQIRAYSSVIYGSGPWGTPTALSGLTQNINSQTSLDLKYNLSARGTTAGYDVAFDVWLTSVPHGGAAAVTTEVMVWLHTGAFAPIGSKVGTYSDATFSGSIYDKSNLVGPSVPHPWNYIAFDSYSDNLTGDVDLLSMLKKAESLGLISGNEYVSSIQLGAEVAYGAGSLTINDLEVSQNGSGNYLRFDQSTYTGTAKSDDIFLYGNSIIASTGGTGMTHDRTYSTTVSMTLTGTIIGGKTAQADVFVNGVDLGTIHLTPTAGTYVDAHGVKWSAPQAFSFSVPGLVDVSELKLVFDGSPAAGGPENQTIYASAVSINGVPLSSAQYHAANGALDQQALGSTVSQYNGGYTLFDTSPWNTYKAANDTGMSAHPITVIGDGGTDTVHVLGTPDLYVISAIAGGSYHLANTDGRGQNAILQGISHVVFQDGESLDPASWLANGDGGHDTVYGGQGADTIWGVAGQKGINGNLGNDVIHGANTNSVLYGGQGNDTIYGGTGADLISGDKGNDILHGGLGADRFLFQPGDGQDWIADFNPAQGDRVILPVGTHYTLTTYQNQAVLDLGNGDQLGLGGVAPSQLPANVSDWLAYF